jgi:hypothetical protein
MSGGKPGNAEIADLLETQEANPHRVRIYRRRAGVGELKLRRGLT